MARQKFVRHIPAMLGTAYLCLCVFVAVFAYLLAPDKTRHANYQVLELAKQAPGTTAWILEIPQPGTEKNREGSFLSGWPQQSLPLALKDSNSLIWKPDQLLYVLKNGVRDSLRLSKFAISATHTSEAIQRGLLKKKKFLLGTDTYGRDLLSRILLGARVSLSVGLMAVLISLGIGIFLGLSAGYFGNDFRLGPISLPLDSIIMWFISVMWSIPTLLLALAISFVLGKGFWQLFLAIGLSIWVEVARLVRGQIMSAKENLYVEAGIALGMKDLRIMFRHILPNIVSPIIVIAVANFGSAVLIESGLSFLGIGVEVPIPTWGQMIYEGYTYIVFDYGQWLALYPGLALVGLIVSINLIGIGLRDALDVRL